MFPAVFGKAFDFCARNDLSGLEDGRYDIDGDRLYVLLQSPATVTEGRFEVHAKYCDLQLLLAGREKHLFAPDLSGMRCTEDAMHSKDAAFYTMPQQHSSLILGPGHYVVYFPGEPHAPCCAADAPASIRKAVFKILW